MFSSTYAPTGRQLAAANGRTRAHFKARPPAVQVRAERGTIVPGPNYTLAASVVAIGTGLVAVGNPLAGVPVALLGTFLGVQTRRVKFRFTDDALEVQIGDKTGTENAVVGGLNRWPYSSFTNWELWWPAFPVLVYFKETQTNPAGQIHFFPCLFDGKALHAAMVERCGSTTHSSTQ